MFDRKPVIAALLGGLVLPLSVCALDISRDVPENRNDPEEVFAYQGDAVLTQTGIDAAFNKIPEEHRLMFIRDGGQVEKMVSNIMRDEVLALDAIANDLLDDPIIRERVIQAAHKELAAAWIVSIRDRAPEADFAAMAYEDYVANPERYATPEYLDVTHILIGKENRSNDRALELAQEVRQKALDNPESFEALVMEYSDDPAKEANAGSYKRMAPGQMAPAFEDAAYELEKPGDISQVVKTDFGFHIIRLDASYPPIPRAFEEVRDETIAKMRKEHIDRYQQNYIRGVLGEGIVLVDGAVEVMLKRWFGENLENAPQY